MMLKKIGWILVGIAITYITFSLYTKDTEFQTQENHTLSNSKNDFLFADESLLQSAYQEFVAEDLLLPSANRQTPKDSLYEWDDDAFEWVVSHSGSSPVSKRNPPKFYTENSNKAINLKWWVLESIQYKLNFFEKLDMEAYAPVFSEALKSIDGQEITITGFVIPIFEDDGPLALSANPYASCFFCGQASPASVLSLYVKNKNKRYKTDDYKTFKGTLHLNYDDPNEFYYILKDAVLVN